MSDPDWAWHLSITLILLVGWFGSIALMRAYLTYRQRRAADRLAVQREEARRMFEAVYEPTYSTEEL